MGFLRKLLIVIAVLVAGYIVIDNWSFIFSQTIDGEIIGVERVTDPTTIIGSNVNATQMFSFAVAIRDQKTNEIYTASSEDRQWAVVLKLLANPPQKKYCAKATFYKYPPWKFEKAGTYFNARLDLLHDCIDSNHVITSVPATEPSSASTPAPTASPSAPRPTP